MEEQQQQLAHSSHGSGIGGGIGGGSSSRKQLWGVQSDKERRRLLGMLAEGGVPGSQQSMQRQWRSMGGRGSWQEQGQQLQYAAEEVRDNAAVLLLL